MAQMPEEGRKFGIVDGYWKDIMVEAVRKSSVFAIMSLYLLKLFSPGKPDLLGFVLNAK